MADIEKLIGSESRLEIGQKINEIIEYKPNADLSNLSTTGEKRFLNKSQITNCLLEVPQNIKVELADGVLTLKAGSKVIVPNGAGVFDEVVIESDISFNGNIDGTHTRMLYYNLSNNYFMCLATHLSGATAPTATNKLVWYDTINNKVKFYNNAADTGTVLSFPIAVVSAGNGFLINSVDQVFNGFGYIGNKFWIDKDVKVLVSNGYNDDGTIKNETIITPSVIVSKGNSVATESIPFLRKYPTTKELQMYSIAKANFLGELDYVPEVGSSFQWYLNINEMKWYMHEAGATEWVSAPYYNISPPITVENGQITSLKPYKPFRAVDWNDFQKLHVNNPYFFGQYIWSEFAPDNLSWLKSSGQWNSGTGYSAFYNWALAEANANKAGFKLSTASYTDYDFVVNTSNKTFRLPIKVKNTPLNTTASVVGNGLSIGLTNGTYNFGIALDAGSQYNGHNWQKNAYGATVGTVVGSNPTDTPNLAVVGVTTDATKSGLVANLSTNTSVSLYFYVGETVRDEFLIDVAQIASNFADKIGRTECKAYITETYRSGTSWYRVWSDGWCEQGGRVASSGTVTFLKPFVNTNYTVCGMQISDGSTNATFVGSYNFHNLTQRTMDFYNGQSEMPTISWIASGYIS